MGAQIYEGQVKKILEYVDIAKNEGARMAVNALLMASSVTVASYVRH